MIVVQVIRIVRASIRIEVSFERVQTVEVDVAPIILKPLLGQVLTPLPNAQTGTFIVAFLWIVTVTEAVFQDLKIE